MLLVEQFLGVEIVVVQALHLLDDRSGRAAVVDPVQALLAVGVTHENVGVVGRLQEIFRVDRARAQRDQVDRLWQVLQPVVVVVVGVQAQRIEEIAVHRHAPHVTHRRRPQQRQHQVIAIGQTPARQRHAKIVVFQRNAELAGRVQEAAHAQGQVDQEPAGALQRLLRTRLQQVVGHRDRHADIGEEIADRAADGRVGDLAVARGNRADHGLVHRIVELVGLAVVLFQRIVGTWLGNRAAGQQRHGNQRREPAQSRGLKQGRHEGARAHGVGERISVLQSLVFCAVFRAAVRRVARGDSARQDTWCAHCQSRPCCPTLPGQISHFFL